MVPPLWFRFVPGSGAGKMFENENLSQNLVFSDTEVKGRADHRS